MGEEEDQMSEEERKFLENFRQSKIGGGMYRAAETSEEEPASRRFTIQMSELRVHGVDDGLSEDSGGQRLSQSIRQGDSLTSPRGDPSARFSALPAPPRRSDLGPLPKLPTSSAPLLQRSVEASEDAPPSAAARPNYRRAQVFDRSTLTSAGLANAAERELERAAAARHTMAPQHHALPQDLAASPPVPSSVSAADVSRAKSASTFAGSRQAVRQAAPSSHTPDFVGHRSDGTPALVEGVDSEEDDEDEISAEEEEYNNLLVEALREDFKDLDRAQLLYRAGRDAQGRTIVVLAAALLGELREETPERLLRYVIRVMDPLVSSEYVFIYCHTSSPSSSMPSFSWLRKVYGLFSRKYRKNLKALLILHPTFWIKGLLRLFRPFISSKFWRKLIYVNSLEEVYEHVPRSVRFPDYVANYGRATPVQVTNRVFGESLQILAERTGAEYPPFLEDALRAVSTPKALEAEGLFRISGSSVTVTDLRRALDRGQEVDFASLDPHDTAGVIKLFLRELPEPLFTMDLYPRFLTLYRSHALPVVAQGLPLAFPQAEPFLAMLRMELLALPAPNLRLLERLMAVLSLVCSCSERNKMSSSNLAIVFGPNMLRPKEEDMLSVMQDQPIINALIQVLIEQQEYLFQLVR